MEDTAELKQVRWQARRVIVKALCAALPLTAIAYFSLSKEWILI